MHEYLVLQARLFAYSDASRYRLGVNYQQLPTNAAKSQVYCPFERDGTMRVNNYGADPNYVGSSLMPTPFYQNEKGCSAQSLSLLTEHEKWVGEICTFQSHITDDDFIQPAALWEVLGRQPGEQDRFIQNLAGHVKGVKYPELRRQVYGMHKLPSKVHANLDTAMFGRVNSYLGEQVQAVTEAKIAS